MTHRIVVNRKVHREVYLHNILEDVLFNIDRRFDQLTEPTPLAGWKDEAVNGLLIIAMLNEGWINAIGEMKVPGWNPKKKAETRIKHICQNFLGDLDEEQRPLKSIHEVRNIRNAFAHAKPLIELRLEEGVTVDQDDQQAAFLELIHPIETDITVSNYRRIREDSAAFRQLLLEKTGLQYWDLKTKSHEDSTFIRLAE